MKILNIPDFIDFSATKIDSKTRAETKINFSLNPNCIIAYQNDSIIDFTEECNRYFEKMNYKNVRPCVRVK
jgi:hypothetical protein